MAAGLDSNPEYLAPKVSVHPLCDWHPECQPSQHWLFYSSGMFLQSESACSGKLYACLIQQHWHQKFRSRDTSPYRLAAAAQLPTERCHVWIILSR